MASQDLDPITSEATKSFLRKELMTAQFSLKAATKHRKRAQHAEAVFGERVAVLAARIAREDAAAKR